MYKRAVDVVTVTVDLWLKEVSYLSTTSKKIYDIFDLDEGITYHCSESIVHN